MQVWELKAALEDCDDGAEVRLMSQPSWPFEYSVDHAVTLTELNASYHEYTPTKTAYQQDPVCGECGGEEFDENHGGFEAERAPAEVVYLVEGQQLGYGTKDAWR